MANWRCCGGGRDRGRESGEESDAGDAEDDDGEQHLDEGVARSRRRSLFVALRGVGLTGAEDAAPHRSTPTKIAWSPAPCI